MFSVPSFGRSITSCGRMCPYATTIEMSGASADVPQKSTLIVPSERLFSVTPRDLVGRKLPDVLREILLHRLPLRTCGPSLEQAEIVDEQLAVQMIDLVLQTAREQIGCLEL